jgi:aerotaxis receptor
MKTPRDAIEGADALYRRFREGRAQGLCVERGHVLRTGLAGLIQRVLHPGLQGRLNWLMLLAAVLICATGGCALSGLGVLPVVRVILTSVAALFVVGWRLQWAIVRPINEAAAIAKQIAAGYLANKIDHASSDEAGQLMHALDAMQKKPGFHG